MNNERIYLLEEADPAIFYGINNRNLMVLRDMFPKLRIMARGNVMKIVGEPLETEQMLKFLHKLEQHALQYNALPEDYVRELAHGTQEENHRDPSIILYGASGKPVVAKTPTQERLAKEIDAKDLVFATGPAGTGKTFLAIAMAVKLLRNKQVRRIILSRPAVEAGEKLGFLPGEMKDKLDPYLQPLYDALMELIPSSKLREYMESSVIQIAPLAFMRGRTLSEAVVILDEAQNTTTHQMKMFLTRLGTNAKMIITGDTSQIDLPRGVFSGLRQAEELLKDKVEGIGWVTFGSDDVLRHSLVTKIVAAYDAHDKEHKGHTPAQEVSDAGSSTEDDD